MTDEELQAWRALAHAAELIMALPIEDDHPMEKDEMASGIHMLQRAIMARPTRRALRQMDHQGQ